MEPKPKTMNEALDRLRDDTRNGFASTFGRDLADALEVSTRRSTGARILPAEMGLK